jgi:putative ABC transport system permease protein
VLASSAIIGTCGAVLGVILGVIAARVGLGAIGGDLGAGYFRGLVAQLEVSGWEIAAFCVLGVLVAIVGALRPAIEAARVPTAAALKAGDVTSSELRTHASLSRCCCSAQSCCSFRRLQVCRCPVSSRSHS